MKSVKHSSGETGHILMATLVIAGVLGIALAAFLNVISSQNSYTVRSQVWNACMPIIEAGLEEALVHINDSSNTAWDDNGWSWDATAQAFTKQRPIGGGYFKVNITTNTGTPIITSTGSLPTPVTVGYGSVFAQLGGGAITNYISRTVQVGTRRDPLFNKALFARENIDFSGNNAVTDSYNSDLGPYSSQTPGDKGDIGTNWTGQDAINSSNAKIKGHVASGPGSSIKMGPNGSIGSATWVSSGTTGIESGWWRNDLNVEIPDVIPPWTGSAPQASGKLLDKYWLENGNYEIPGDMNLNSVDSMVINGNATLWVKGDVKMNGLLTINPGASLKIYISGSKAVFSGQYVKSDSPADLQIFGLPSCTYLSIGGATHLEAVIDAPSAQTVINGISTLSGSAIIRTIKFTGNAAFHYDEALSKLPFFYPFIVTSWEEI
jgi:hypothetical protein